ncbi:MAG: hypothetical protein R2851_22360 [Caldilineaceae bacterium]
METPQGRYWRAVVYDTFNGYTWENTTEEQVEFDADEPFPVANWQLRTPLTQTITLLKPPPATSCSARPICAGPTCPSPHWPAHNRT